MVTGKPKPKLNGYYYHLLLVNITNNEMVDIITKPYRLKEPKENVKHLKIITHLV